MTGTALEESLGESTPRITPRVRRCRTSARVQLGYHPNAVLAQKLASFRHCMGELAGEIHTERANTWAPNRALSDLQDEIAEIARVGWKVKNDPMHKNQDRVVAMREIREAYNTYFRA